MVAQTGSPTESPAWGKDKQGRTRDSPPCLCRKLRVASGWRVNKGGGPNACVSVARRERRTHLWMHGCQYGGKQQTGCNLTQTTFKKNLNDDCLILLHSMLQYICQTRDTERPYHHQNKLFIQGASLSSVARRTSQQKKIFTDNFLNSFSFSRTIIFPGENGTAPAPPPPQWVQF